MQNRRGVNEIEYEYIIPVVWNFFLSIISYAGSFENRLKNISESRLWVLQ